MEISFGTWIIVVFDLYIFLFVFVFGNKPFLCISTLKNDKFFAFTCSLLPFSHKTPLISLTIHTHGASCWRKMTNALTWHRNMIKLHNTENFFLRTYFLYFCFPFTFALWKWQIYHIYLGGAKAREQKQISAKWLGNCANKYHQSVNNHHTHAIGGF
jgi:hypothetical protein